MTCSGGASSFPSGTPTASLVGFGGRTLDDSQPKYLNSPRSPIFDKSHILYALHLAKDAIKDRGVVIVEGYMDAIMAHQHGFSNVVASMGTALTREQTSLARKVVGRPSPSQSREVVLALDPDAAGQEATLRSLESSWNVFQTTEVGRSGRATLYQRPEALSLKIAALPQGKDPDEIISESPDEWSRLVEEAVPLMDYLFRRPLVTPGHEHPRGEGPAGRAPVSPDRRNPRPLPAGPLFPAAWRPTWG